MLSAFLENVVKEIRNIGSSQIIVEGKRDREVLEKLGFKNILEISGKSLFEILKEIKKEPVILLTDFDEEGEKLAKELYSFLKIYGIRVDELEREILRKIFGVNKIEELNFFVKFMEDDVYGKACSIYDKIFNRSRILVRRNSRKT